MQLRRGYQHLFLEGECHGVRGRQLELGWVSRGEHRNQLVLTLTQDADRADGDAAEDRDRASQVGGAIFELNGTGRVLRCYQGSGESNPTQPEW